MGQFKMITFKVKVFFLTSRQKNGIKKVPSTERLGLVAIG